MYNLYCAIVLVIFCVLLTCVKAAFEKNSIFDNLSCETVVNIKQLGSSRSKLECSSQCRKEIDCQGFFFNKGAESCHGVHVILTSSHGCNSNVGNVYYFTTDTYTTTTPTQTPSVYGSLCSLTSDCTSAHVICLDGMCKCDAGYRFESATLACITVCERYGSDYIKYSDMGLYVSHINEYLNTNLDQCKVHCTNTPACMGFNYQQSTEKCRTKSDTPLTSPNEWATAIGVDYYSRNCE